MREPYQVADVRTADGAAAAPPEIRERFDGRSFTLIELEQRGVRVTGAGAWYLANGQDWQLLLHPLHPASAPAPTP
jgi:hypothetical protein